jgi:N4-(beta-N-acetylglucosaminyl)-L-asparaginase
MRQGKSPNEACKEAVDRIIKKHKDIKGLQVGFLAINKNGEVGGHSVYSGFNYAQKDNTTEEMKSAPYEMEW